MRIVVLAGGYSPEREVSLSSGSLIANALIENGHSVLLLDVYEGMRELPADPASLFRREGRYEYRVQEAIPDLAALKARTGNGNALIGANVGELCRMADVVFIALHGAMGENGQLQAYLDVCGIPYTGSGYDGCLLSMDKDLAKRILRDAGVPTPRWICFDEARDSVDSLIEEIGLPCVVKPCGCGSSVGVSFAHTREELERSLAEARRWDAKVLVEEMIEGRELTVGILGGKALPPVEILPKSGFYDYQNKYQGSTEEICPADLPSEIAERLAELTCIGFDALHLKCYARFDYLLDREGKIWCLEANSLPGMTPTSLLPTEAAAVGISYGELCERILELAKKK